MWLGPPELSLSSQAGVGGQESGHKLSLPKGTQSGNSEEGQPVSWESEALVVWDGKWTSTIAGSLPRDKPGQGEIRESCRRVLSIQAFLNPSLIFRDLPNFPCWWICV